MSNLVEKRKKGIIKPLTKEDIKKNKGCIPVSKSRKVFDYERKFKTMEDEEEENKKVGCGVRTISGYIGQYKK